MQTSDFFRLILPETGWKCLFTLPDKRHYWFTDFDALAEAALRLDAAGQTVYHGCASFKTQQRSKTNVDHVKCFWLDVDCGPSKPYNDAGEAYGAVTRWRETASVPAPFLVASGGGLHAYWPLLDAIQPDKWLDGAAGLQHLVNTHGLAVDSAVTRDLARVLRPINTHNYKFDPAVPVSAGARIPPYEVATILQAFRPFSAPLGVAAASASDDEFTFAPESRNDPADPLPIVHGCRQVQRLRDAGGVLPEPEWYAVLGVLAHCGPGGWAIAHDFSCDDPRYDQALTDKKLEQARTAAGPTTCGRFEQLHRAGCEGCEHRGNLTSPILLGRQNLPAPVVAAKPEVLELPRLPGPFYWDRARLAVRAEKDNEDGQPAEPVIIADYPVYVHELQQSERSEGVSAVFRTWEPMAKAWREFTLPMQDICGDRGLGHLAKHGVVLRKKVWPLFLSFVVSIANNLRGTRDYGTRYEQFGWKADGFVIGTTLLRPNAAPVAIHGSVEVTRRAKLLRTQGSVAAWSEATNALFARPGLEGHAFAVLCCFGAPLYRLTNAVGTTFAHMRSRESGRGKSTVLEVGCSVFGELDGMQIIKTDTPVAKFIFLGVSGNLPVIYDELRDPDTEVVKDFVLQATLGRDKHRGDVHGGLRGDALPWSTILLSAANVSLVDTVRANGGEVAQASRIFEYAFDAPPLLSKAEGDALLQQCRDNSGTAGRAFLQHVVDHRSGVQAMVTDAMRTIEATIGSGPEQRFIIRLLGCVATAGLIAKQLGLVAFDITAIMRWAIGIARGSQEVVADDKNGDLAAVVGSLMNDLLPGTLVMPGPYKPGPRPEFGYNPVKLPLGALVARFEVDSRLWEANADVVRTWMLKHHRSFVDIQTQLLALGVLKRRLPMKTLGRGWQSTAGQVRVWEVDCKHPLVAEIVEEAGLTTVVRLEQAS